MRKDEFKTLLSQSVESQPDSWLSFYRRYNINPKTKQPINDIYRACRQFGASALREVNRILQSESISGFSGKDFLNNLKDAVLGEIIDGTTTETETKEEKEQREAEEKAEAEEQKKSQKNTRIAIFVGAGVVVLGVIISIILLRK